MIVYGHRSFALDLPSFLSQFSARLAASAPSSSDALIDLLIDFGEAESAVADALLPEVDDEHEAVSAWRAAGAALADAFCASTRGDAAAAARHLDCAAAQVRALEEGPAVRRADARTGEGFACYALHPRQYIDAARQLVATGARSVFCLGLRSAGSVLGHVVAATCRSAAVAADFRSVRPRGHPFDRQLRIGDRLRAAIESAAATDYAVVDEGPGLSGSSFAAAVETLEGIGIAADRIALVPSWNAAAESLRSERGRRAWSAHRRFVGVVDHAALAADAVAGAAGAQTADLSAGCWRDRVFAAQGRAAWPPTQPQHERVKFLYPALGTTTRFAGLGRYGRAKQQRAAVLADARFGAEAGHLTNGFLALRWIDGQPLIAGDGEVDLSVDLVHRLADYLAFVRATFCTGQVARTDDLIPMLHANVREGLGIEQLAAVEQLPTAYEEPEVGVDGRMLPHEWIRSPGAAMKTDALDHHADDFLPGCRDIAWDIAGTVVEFAMTEAAAETLVRRYAAASGDSAIGARLSFYTAAYLAYRIGYVSLAAEGVGEPDAASFRRAASRYRRLLAVRLARPGRAARY